MPSVTKRPSNQAHYLQANDPGICNALVLEWLSPINGGRDLAMRRTAPRARNLHNRGVRFDAFRDYGLSFSLETLRDFPVQTSHELQLALLEIQRWQSEGLVDRFFIGLSGSGGQGHAIGLIYRSDQLCLGYDPNNGFYRIEPAGDDGDNFYILWLALKIMKSRLKQNYSEVLAIGCRGYSWVAARPNRARGRRWG